MKYIGQIGLLMLVTFLGELFNKVLPWPVPGSIYGFILMLLSLQLKIIRLEMIKDVADFIGYYAGNVYSGSGRTFGYMGGCIPVYGADPTNLHNNDPDCYGDNW